LTDPFIVGEKEGLIPLDRASAGNSEIVAVERWDDRSVKEVSRIKTLIPEEPIRASMETVGP
jgi:hypothetical protein